MVLGKGRIRNVSFSAVVGCAVVGLRLWTAVIVNDFVVVNVSVTVLVVVMYEVSKIEVVTSTVSVT